MARESVKSRWCTRVLQEKKKRASDSVALLKCPLCVETHVCESVKKKERQDFLIAV